MQRAPGGIPTGNISMGAQLSLPPYFSARKIVPQASTDGGASLYSR